MNLGKMATGVVVGILGIVITFVLISSLAPTLQEAGDNLSQTPLPLSSLFSGTGIVMLIVMVGVLIGVIAMAMKIGKGGA